MKNKELAPLQKKIDTIAQEAKKIEIKDEDSLKVAVEILSNMNKYVDSVKEKKELLTKPLNEALKNARGMFKPLELTYEEAIEVLRGKMTVYQTKLVQERLRKEAEIANRIGEGKGKLKIETAVKKIEGLEVVEKEVASSAGLVQFRETKVLKITDVLSIPREYLIVDESKLLKALKEGIVVSGAMVETIQVPVNYR